MSFFDELKKSIGGVASNIKEGFFGGVQKVDEFFKPAPEVRGRDIVRELVSSVNDMRGSVTRGFVGSLNTIGKEITGQKDTEYKPTTQFEKGLFGTDKPFGYKSEYQKPGEDIAGLTGLEGTPKKIVGGGLGVGLFALDMFTGGGKKKVAEEWLTSIAKTTDTNEIKTILKTQLPDAADDFVESVSTKLKDIKTPKDVLPVIQTETARDIATKEYKSLGLLDDEAQALAEDTVDKVKATMEVNGTKSIAEDISNIIEAEKEKVRVARNLPKETGLSPERFTQRMAVEESVNPQVRELIQERVSPTIKDVDLTSEAERIVRENVAEAEVRSARTEARSALDNEVSRQLFTKLQNDILTTTDELLKKNLIEKSLNIIETISRDSRTQGQAISALRLWSKVTPEGAVLKAQKLIDRVNDTLPKGKQKKLTQEMVDSYKKQITDAQSIADEADRLKAIAGVLAKMEADIIPASLMKKISTMQTIFQLLNPKTIIRNVIGNATFNVLENISDIPAVAFDSALSFITGNRSTAFGSLKTQLKGAKAGWKEGIDQALKGVNVDSFGSQFDIPNTRVFKEGSVAEKLQKTLDVVLRGPDRAFFQAAYDNSLYKQMKAAKVTEATEEMKEIATFDGLYKTFQDENVTTRAFSALKKTVLNFGLEFGMGDVILKYPKTPANLLNRGLAYSPLGFFNTAFEMLKPAMGKKWSQKAAAEAFGRASVGTGMGFGIGATMYNLGLISSSQDKDYDVANLQKKTGFGQYKINLSGLKRFVFSGFDASEAKVKEGDTLVSYDWLQPYALSLALGADFAKKDGDKNSTLGTILSSIESGVNTLSEQPLVSGVTNLVKYGEIPGGLLNAIKKLPASFVPSFFNQIRQLVDSQSRITYSPDVTEEVWNSIKNRLPGASFTLKPQYDVLGDKTQLYQDDGNNVFNVFFNPAFVSKYKLTPEAKMVLDLYDATGEKRQFPNTPKKNLKINGEDKKLSTNQYYHMQKLTGTLSKFVLSNYANNPEFKKMSEADQVKEISNALTSIGQASRVFLLGDQPKRLDKDTPEILQALIDMGYSTK